MTTTLTGSAGYSATATGPAAGESQTVASVNGPFQTLLNSIVFLYAGGVNLRSVATSAALKALTGMANGEVALIQGASQLGLYVFRTGTPVGSDVTGWRYDATSGTGVWYHHDYDKRSYRVISAQDVDLAAGDSTASAAYVTLLNASIAVASCLVGDIIDISYYCQSVIGAILGTDAGAMKCVVNDGGVDYDLLSQETILPASLDATAMAVAGSGLYTVTVAGTCTVKIVWKATTGNMNVASSAPYGLVAKLLRY